MSLLSRLAPGALVGAALLASSFLGSSVSVSVRDRLEGVRDTPVDIVVTSRDPVTVLEGHRYLAPDAWMTQGSVTPDQVRALRDIPGVEVAAPVTVVDLADQDTEQVVSAWVPRPAADQDGDHLRAWRVQVTVSVTDGTGTRVSAPSFSQPRAGTCSSPLARGPPSTSCQETSWGSWSPWSPTRA